MAFLAGEMVTGMRGAVPVLVLVFSRAYPAGVATETRELNVDIFPKHVTKLSRHDSGLVWRTRLADGHTLCVERPCEAKAAIGCLQALNLS